MKGSRHADACELENDGVSYIDRRCHWVYVSYYSRQLIGLQYERLCSDINLTFF